MLIMNLLTLGDSPKDLLQTLDFVEDCFNYSVKESFFVDFNPLFHDFSRCLILKENDKVIAHGAYCIKSLTTGHSMGMIGGICVHKNYRKRGLGLEIIQSLLKKTDHCAFTLLWSDKLNFYQKLGFEPVGVVNQYEKDYLKNSKFKKTSYKNLSKEDKKQISSLYKNDFCKKHISVNRFELDWSIIENIVSANFYYLKVNDTIVAYYVKDKGMDLQNIVYEFSCLSEYRELLEEELKSQTVWTSKKNSLYNREYKELLFSLCKPGKKFDNFLKFLSIKKIGSLNNIWNTHLNTFYISGLDSV